MKPEREQRAVNSSSDCPRFLNVLLPRSQIKMHASLNITGHSGDYSKSQNMLDRCGGSTTKHLSIRLITFARQTSAVTTATPSSPQVCLMFGCSHSGRHPHWVCAADVILGHLYIICDFSGRLADATDNLLRHTPQLNAQNSSCLRTKLNIMN